jgi:hypothetical protein
MNPDIEAARAFSFQKKTPPKTGGVFGLRADA